MNQQNIELDGLYAAAEQAWQNYNIPEINADTWGMFSYGDAPAGIGGGTGCFMWFATREGMLEFVTDVFPFSPPGPNGSDELAVVREVKRIIEQLLAGQLSGEGGRELLNRALQHYSQIEWWGTFDALCSGQHLYAQKVIQYFRESLGSSHKADIHTPIKVGEIESFKAFLQDFGN
jgi:hypothetical protein